MGGGQSLNIGLANIDTFTWIGGFSSPRTPRVRPSLCLIRIHRNHPSIIIWSMDNEAFFSEKRVRSKVQRFLSELLAYLHELDQTRPAAIGGCKRGDIDKLCDIAGYNDDARLFANPGIPSIVTEYGSAMADRPGKYESG